jgi:hypothetical protein
MNPRRSAPLCTALLLMLAGCSHETVHKADTPRADAPGQWILDSYNEKTGYTFRKDGVIYQTSCEGVNYGYGKGAEPVRDQSLCSPVLEYLHKPVPSLRLGFLDKNGTTVLESESTLYFEVGQRAYLFGIVEAK